MKSLDILNCSLLQTNKLMIPLQKHGGKDIPVLSLAKKCWFEATYDLNVEVISFAIK